jgi:acyl carrier protein
MEADIVAFLEELHPETDFSQSQDYVSDGLLDSFDLVSLVAMIEEKFSVFIDALDIVPENFASVQAIAGLVSKSGGGA